MVVFSPIVVVSKGVVPLPNIAVVVTIVVVPLPRIAVVVFIVVVVSAPAVVVTLPNNSVVVS